MKSNTMPIPRWKKRARALRRGDILRAAERLFAHNGYFKTSMAEIAQEAESAVGSLYRVFPSKEAIYIALMEEKFEQYVALVRDEVTDGDVGRSPIEALIRTKLGFFEEHRDFFRIYAMEWGAATCAIKGGLGARIGDLRATYMQVLTETMRDATARGMLSPHDPSELAQLLDGMLNAVIQSWIVSTGDQSLSAKAEVINHAFLFGVAAHSQRAVRKS